MGRRLGILAAGLAAALLGAPTPGGAVVGASQSGAAFANRLVMVLSRGSERQAFCTGIVLEARVILTAAHCVGAIGGMAILYRDAEEKPVLIGVAAAAIHPLYRADANVAREPTIDMALVETVAPIDPRFVPARLAEGDGPPVGSDAILAGYGDGREGDSDSGGTLRSARLAVRAPLSDILLWTEDADGGGAGACRGDSGGPLFLADAETVAAVVFWTSGSVRGKHCGAITQGALVAPQRGWIEKTMTKWGR
ncbi:MAG: trypsin-like serine protease [Bradyrhizobium sp.]|nr:MAG: trypsin-like serine protease [Bradyrhizobium sp.]